MALDIEFFDKITQTKMSIYAHKAEQNEFFTSLKKKITREEGEYLKYRHFTKKIDFYRDWNTLPEYIYYWDSEAQCYHLHYVEGTNVLLNLYTMNYKYVRGSGGYRNQPIGIMYLTDLPNRNPIRRTGLPEGYRWTNVRTKKINYIQDYLKPSILSRYAMFNRPTNGLSNVITDSFMPKLMYQFNFDVRRMKTESKLPSTAVTISPWFAHLFDVKQISLEQMCRILGYTKKDIKNLLVAVKRKEHTISFIGYGGTGVNTIHWLTEMCTMTHTLNLFKQVNIYENDNLEISNLLRFPKNPEALQGNSYGVHNKSKLSLLTDYELNTLSKNKPIVSTQYVGSYELHYNDNIKNSVIYGAPDIVTRELCAIHNVKFIAATHTGNSAYIHLNPTQDSDLTVETYGLIQLSIFFMNQLKLAISLLETLGDDEIDLTAKDVEVLNYTFNQNDSLTTDRKYNFQLDHDGHMVTEEEADAVV